MTTATMDMGTLIRTAMRYAKRVSPTQPQKATDVDYPYHFDGSLTGFIHLHIFTPRPRGKEGATLIVTLKSKEQREHLSDLFTHIADNIRLDIDHAHWYVRLDNRFEAAHVIWENGRVTNMECTVVPAENIERDTGVSWTV